MVVKVLLRLLIRKRNLNHNIIINIMFMWPISLGLVEFHVLKLEKIFLEKLLILIRGGKLVGLGWV